MKSIRKIMQSPNDSITVELPPEFRRRHLEVIVTPVSGIDPMDSTWPEGFFARIAGAWQGEPLQRPPQGDFEQRQPLA